MFLVLASERTERSRMRKQVLVQRRVLLVFESRGRQRFGAVSNLFQTLDLLFAYTDILLGRPNERVKSRLFLLSERDVCRMYLGTLVEAIVWREIWMTQFTGLTVFRSLRSASTFCLYASPTSLQVFAHTPGRSSEPSQQSW